MEDEYDSVQQKVASIFQELAGDRAKTLSGSTLPASITSTITNALLNQNAEEKEILLKDEIAFHLTDWNSDAAFLVALHLFPERFTQNEIRAGVDLFLAHVPAHIIAAARLSEKSVEDIFLNSKYGHDETS
jgi:hypothetical protein